MDECPRRAGTLPADLVDRFVERQRGGRQTDAAVVVAFFPQRAKVGSLHAEHQRYGRVLLRELDRAAGESCRAKAQAVDVLVELLGVRLEAIDERGTEMQQLRHDRIAGELQTFETHVD